MGQKTPITQSFNLPDGREVVLETGKLATQADGSCVIRIGKTMLFASVVSAHEPREGQSFFPLSVDYQEKYASIGRIPGNFFRREARLSDYEILASRLVDRAIRPLFPDGYMNDTQVIINLISAEQEVMPDAFVALAASTALSVSDIPFSGPISEVRVAKVNGEYLVNPNRDKLANATLNIIIAASIDNVMMVEGDAKEVAEKELVEAIKVGHDAIKVQCQAQLDLAAKVGESATVKRVIEAAPENEEVKQWIDDTCRAGLEKVCRGGLAKHERKAGYKEVKEAMKAARDEKFDEEFLAENNSFFGRYFDKLKKEIIRELILSEKLRLDGRNPETVRPIWTEIDYLPSAHGSAIFNRGETQALTSLTLGSKLDQAMVDTALDMYYENFI
ncbi:MAG: polyribonucleotide nucleotidyltransferase, partial [Flavobacteriales bacterium]|nr:polyribonucleotide nucleotidyltransferase [Flavobacteriales bacterium]